MEIFLPPLLITKDFVDTSGEEKVYHPTRPPPGGFRFLSETASLQEAGRALAIGPPTGKSHPFLVRSSNYASGVLPANEDTTPVFPFIPSGSFLSLFIERTKFTYTRVRKTFPTINFPLWMSRLTILLRLSKKKGEGQGSLGQKSYNYQFEFRKHQISPSRIRTYDQSVNSRPLYH